MARSNVVHKKYKNTGILFELLVRQITVDTMNSKKESPALRLVREYFKPTSELGKEYILYRTLLESINLTESKANTLIDIVLKERRALNNRRLSEQKYELVREVKELYDLKDFLSAKIPNYRVYASIYKTFLSESKPEKIDVRDVADVARARFTITEHMMSKPSNQKRESKLLEYFRNQTEDLRLLTYKVLVDKFNAKYANLNEEQKVLLREYINNISNTNDLRDYINKEVPKVQRKLKKRINKVDNEVTRIKLQEVVSQLDNVAKGKVVRDAQVSALLVAYQIIREIDDILEKK